MRSSPIQTELAMTIQDDVRNRGISYGINYMQNLKNNQNSLTKQAQIQIKTMVTKGEGGRDKLGVWDEQIHTNIYKTNKDLLQSTENYIHYLVITNNEK